MGSSEPVGPHEAGVIPGPLVVGAVRGLAAECLAGGGNMGALMRAYDFSRTPLGPVDRWPQSLRTAVSIMLASRFPMLLLWGEHYIQLYNDAFRPILGATKHPAALGQCARDCWSEIWDALDPMFRRVMDGGDAIWNEDLQFVLDRNGYLEETFFTFSYSAIRDESGRPGGLLVTCVETTERVIGERRLRTLRELAAQASSAQSVQETCATAARILSANAHDLPFVLLYLSGGSSLRLSAAAGVEPATAVSPELVALDDPAAVWPLAQVIAEGAPRLVTGLPESVGALPGGPWPEVATAALVLPVTPSPFGKASGALVAGISPRRALDVGYRSFLELVAAQISTALSAATAYEAERERSRALAEVDRAKTAFFANISHEFRTPLTLMLGPLEDALADPRASAVSRERLEVAHRNALRLLKLVNTLLDFSRIEAGRVEASYEPADLAALTADLASNFRSAVERADMTLTIDCPPQPEPVYVDREMWEKIVLNLLSNAFKFTFEGGITVALRQIDGAARLRVSDTGTGIPAAEIPRLFERFQRVKGARSRSYEGSGIGLALVQELVRLHGGSITVDSEVDRGTVFTVTIPLGRTHLSADRIAATRTAASTALRADAFVQEALRWLPGDPGAGSFATRDVLSEHAVDQSYAGSVAISAGAPRHRVLVVDDNADMREYLGRLLAGYEIEAVGDGTSALRAARRRTPDLVLADVMLPGIDGFELLRELRAEAGTRDVPVILLSARAGEESRIEGLEAGADDYLAKPFSARELLARVDAHVSLARLRHDSETQRVRLIEQLRDQDRRKDEFLAMLAHELRNPLAPIRTGLQLIQRAAQTPALMQKACTIMERQLEHLVRLVDDLLDVSRVSRNKLELRRELVDLTTILQNAVEMSRPLIEAGGHDLTLRLADEPLLLDADAVRLSQAFANLLNNAAKYTERGGRIRVTSDLECDPAGGAGEVIVSVRDTGIGIAADKLPHIFEMFVQGDRASERSQGGLGIGLTLAQRLVQMHGGSLSAFSDGPGRGSEFVVRLPLAISPATLRVDPAGQDDADKARLRRRILVVDDNSDSAELLATTLELLGHEVEIAHDGLEAVAKVAALHPDVAFMDLGMPRMDGYDAARRIRQQPSGRDVRLVALTGWGHQDDKRRSREAGFDAHLVKPVDMAALEQLLDELPLDAPSMADDAGAPRTPPDPGRESS